MSLILASGSPRRRELLARVGLKFDVRAAEIDESVQPGEDPVSYVRRLSVAKAEAVAAAHPGAYVIGADTTVALGARIFGKAADDAEARAMLQQLFGTEHSVVTGYAVLGPNSREVGHASTQVVMRTPSESDLRGYLACGEWRGKAGAYAVQGIAAAFVTAVHGSITNVIGLPLAEVLVALESIGGPRPALDRGDSA